MTDAKQFFSVQPVSDSLNQLFQEIIPFQKTETLQTTDALGRTLAESPLSPVDLPGFNRSAMDGFAVKASDTFGATDALPAYLTVSGQVLMGEVPQFTLQQGQAAEIHTGAMLPDGADAVVMIENTQPASETEIEVLSSVAPGENVIHIGEDVRKDSETLPSGHQLRPQDIGGLLAVGIQQVRVVAKPQVAILSSGDELVEVHETPQLGQIRDINSHMLAALCIEAGAETQRLGIASDTFEHLSDMAKQGLEQADMLVLSAGSSVSNRDLTQEVIQQLGKPGILQHGLAVKPGKPTIIAVCDGKPVIGLPGNPVSALLVAHQVILPIIQYLMGKTPKPLATIQARLTQNIPSTTGREDTIPVRLIQTDDGYEAEPVFGKSNLIYTLLRSDGLIHIPLNVSGYTAGTIVEVLSRN